MFEGRPKLPTLIVLGTVAQLLQGLGCLTRGEDVASHFLRVNTSPALGKAKTDFGLLPTKKSRGHSVASITIMPELRDSLATPANSLATRLYQ